MSKYITRRIAGMETCKFTFEDVRRLNNRPEMCAYTCLNWLDSFGSWIESAYNGKLSTYEEMAAEFNKNIHRQFEKPDGKIIDYCRLIKEYLSFMCQQDNNGRGYTIKRFNAFTAGYKEVFA